MRLGQTRTKFAFGAAWRSNTERRERAVLPSRPPRRRLLIVREDDGIVKMVEEGDVVHAMP